MKTSKYAKDPIAFALRQAAAGTRVAESRREFAISLATFYNWRKKTGRSVLSAWRRLTQLEDVNARFKKLVADPGLNKEMRPEFVRKNP